VAALCRTQHLLGIAIAGGVLAAAYLAQHVFGAAGLAHRPGIAEDA
jgi:hypothetical protein